MRRGTDRAQNQPSARTCGSTLKSQGCGCNLLQGARCSARCCSGAGTRGLCAAGCCDVGKHYRGTGCWVASSPGARAPARWRLAPGLYTATTTGWGVGTLRRHRGGRHSAAAQRSCGGPCNGRGGWGGRDGWRKQQRSRRTAAAAVASSGGGLRTKSAGPAMTWKVSGLADSVSCHAPLSVAATTPARGGLAATTLGSDAEDFAHSKPNMAGVRAAGSRVKRRPCPRRAGGLAEACQRCTRLS